jgi:HD-like signal output (HDOD) protein
MKVLFVDDESRVLDAMRDMLRKQRTRWDMRFAVGGPAALEVLGAEAFDVVVTDLRMPRVDGFELLEHLRAHHPRTVRLALSGDAKRETAIRLAPQAHRALMKPCKAGELEAALESAGKLRELIDDDELRDTVGRIVDLPSMPLAYTKLEQVLSDGRATYATVAEVLSADIALSATLLKIANSSVFGAGHVVSSVDHAIALLGTEVVKTVVLSAGVFGRRELPSHMRDFAKNLHEHSVLVARVAAELGGDATSRKTAFSTGMLHDIGALVLALEAPAGTKASELGADYGAKTNAHARVGAYLLALWGVPASTIEAVARHHDVDDSCTRTARLIAAAEELVEGEPHPTPTELDALFERARELSPTFASNHVRETRS